ncbi:MAG: helix-turn-helix transcriptional regulator [Candidatus Beckwithbacteria bacterium]|nr:helix-turn-helix domain-containing protein [Patescibacteria group bacterium]
MKLQTITLDNYLKKQLKDPEFKKLWEAGEPQYQATRQLIKARIDKKISQRQLAKKAKTTQAVISRIENMTVNPTIGLLQKLGHALDKRMEIRFKPLAT